MKRILLCLMAFSAIISSCTRDHGDMYDPEFVREYYESQWKKQFGEIDPNQTWNVAQGVQANLSIKEDALADYTFNIYTSNPLYDKDAKLMAKTKVTTDAEGYAETSIKFDAPNGLKYFYVMRVNKNGRRAVKAIQAAGGVLNATFGDVNPQGARAIEEGRTLPTIECPYTVEDIETMIVSGHDLKDGWTGQYLSDLSNHQTIYVTTEMDLPLSLECKEKKYLIIADGGVLNFIQDGGNVENVEIIVAAGGVLNIKQTLAMFTNSSLIVMPGGVVNDLTDSSDLFSINCNASTVFLYNGGKMLDMRMLNINNGATVYFANNSIYKGQVIQFASDGVITNWGKVEVVKLTNHNDSYIGNNLGTLNNGCLLRSSEKIQLQFLNVAGYTAVECPTISVPFITLRENSIVRTDYLFMGQAFQLLYRGDPISSALVTAKKIEANAGGVTIDSNVYLEANSISSDWMRECAERATEISPVGESEFAIFPAYKGDDLERSDCTGQGNVPNDYVPETPANAIKWIIACEDLGSIGDYDFNDIVFSVTYVAGDETAVVEALAAGGTIPANVYVNNELIGEIHGLFGFDDTSKMINTLEEDLEDGSIFQGMVKTIAVPTNFSISTSDMGKIRIEIINGDGNVKTAIAPTQGSAPQMICVPAPWKWPVEYTSIGAAYPKFGLWGAGYNEGDNWYSTDIATGSVFNLE